MPLEPHNLSQVAETCARDRAEGCVWRARDRLRQRIGQSDYDPALFRLYADVLADMQDDDEAGRYYFLCGERDGRSGELSKAFLDRRHKRKLHLVWGDMPKAASRVAANSIPDACRSDLEANGHTPDAVDSFIGNLVDAEGRRVEALAARKTLAADGAAPTSWTAVIVFSASIGLFVAILALGTVELIRWLDRAVSAFVRWS